MPKVTVRRRKRGAITIAKSGRVKIGYPAGTSSSVLDKAAWNHFGTAHIPERPFISNAMRDNRAEYRAAMARAAKAIVNGKTTTQQTLTRLGIKAQGDIQTEIVNLRSPPNAPSTIARKGSSNPLIDTGEMRQATTYKVEGK